jgi:hypothetical protein
LPPFPKRTVILGTKRKSRKVCGSESVSNSSFSL